MVERWRVRLICAMQRNPTMYISRATKLRPSPVDSGIDFRIEYGPGRMLLRLSDTVGLQASNAAEAADDASRLLDLFWCLLVQTEEKDEGTVIVAYKP